MKFRKSDLLHEKWICNFLSFKVHLSENGMLYTSFDLTSILPVRKTKFLILLVDFEPIFRIVSKRFQTTTVFVRLHSAVFLPCGWIFMKINIWNFFLNLSRKFNFYKNMIGKSANYTKAYIHLKLGKWEETYLIALLVTMTCSNVTLPSPPRSIRSFYLYNKSCSFFFLQKFKLISENF